MPPENVGESVASEPLQLICDTAGHSVEVIWIIPFILIRAGQCFCQAWRSGLSESDVINEYLEVFVGG